MHELVECLITVEEFDQFLEQPQNRDHNFELINGAIVEKMPTQIHGRLAAALSALLTIYSWQYTIGHVEVEVRYRPPGDSYNDRQPDVSVNLSTDAAIAEGTVIGLPDLAIEIRSPSDSYQHMIDTARYYLSNGSKMVWLVYPEKKLIEVLTVTDRQLLSVEDTLSGGDLLPGFAVTVGDIFARI